MQSACDRASGVHIEGPHGQQKQAPCQRADDKGVFISTLCTETHATLEKWGQGSKGYYRCVGNNCGSSPSSDCCFMNSRISLTTLLISSQWPARRLVRMSMPRSLAIRSTTVGKPPKSRTAFRRWCLPHSRPSAGSEQGNSIRLNLDRHQVGPTFQCHTAGTVLGHGLQVLPLPLSPVALPPTLPGSRGRLSALASVSAKNDTKGGFQYQLHHASSAAGSAGR